ncbi:CubicO group peptidase (beta-lactamase class C family) [Lysobacter niabensis]|uniref:CubicO group peptidase (Beta-lactamase class C family) n=1 Tax=Agrilutibacter niabensis TaxID=380628 RepID=A0ABU1VNB6_9GAMM|nr:serine hydrolase [Lysobacter niabensis]MDR7098835.1 CubicO group peptidase (beta-lactamase class C family) [Lysobacter niabensis]
MPHPSRAIATILVAALALAGPAISRPKAPARPQSAASNGSAQRLDLFQRQVEADRNALGIPGLSMVVIEDGDVLSARGFGYADIEHRIPATADTLYHIASVTKTFTSILVMQLVEQGKLDLDEPVSHYSSDFKDDSVRIKHLLSHTSEGTPGEKFSYNPERFEYLKAVLEKKTGKPLRQLFVETFLDPLKMRDSVPGPDVADDDTTWAMLGKANLARYRQNLKNSARPYTYWGDGEIVYPGYPPRDFWASAGLLSTVRDMAKYDAAIDNHVLLKPETLARAWTPFRSNSGQPLAMGLGWYVTDYRGERLIWHYGHWGTGFSALYLKVPARHLTLVAFANSEALADHHYKVGEDVTNDLFACDFINTFVPEVALRGGGSSHAAIPEGIPDSSRKTFTAGPASDCMLSSRTALANWKADRHAKARKAIPLERDVLAAHAGGYKLPHRVITVSQEDGHLYIDVPQGERSELFAETPTQFFLKIRPWTLTFVKEGSKVVRLDILDSGEIVSGPKVD